MKRNNGFTLIELVVVIVILGILAVTAAPRFITLQQDARNSALHGLQGALSGATKMVYTKAAIEGKEADHLGGTSVLVNGNEVQVYGGYPNPEDLDYIVQGLTGASDIIMLDDDRYVGSSPDWKRVWTIDPSALPSGVTPSSHYTTAYTFKDTDNQLSTPLDNCMVTYSMSNDATHHVLIRTVPCL